MNSRRQTEVLVISMLADGSSVRAVERVTGLHRDSVLRILVRVGNHCRTVMDGHFQDLIFNALELDEAWGFVGKKEKNCAPWEVELGDQYVYVAQDPETKLIPCFTVGKRTQETTESFLADLASRVNHDLQVATISADTALPDIHPKSTPTVVRKEIIRRLFVV